MAEGHPPVAHFYEENGTVYLGINDEWWNQSKDEYISFNSFKYYFRQRAKEDQLVNFDVKEGMEGLIENAPDAWLSDEESDDFTNKVIFGFICRFVSDKALKSLAQREYNSVEKLIEERYFKTTIIRESAFFEEFLVLMCMREFRDTKFETLSKKDLNLIEHMGHSDRIRLARLLRVLNEKQHGYLQEMASRRNEIAHTPWGEFSKEEEADIQRVAVKTHEILKRLADSMITRRTFE